MAIPPAPPTLNYMPADPDRAYLRYVAMQQRGIMVCILIDLIVCFIALALFALPESARMTVGGVAMAGFVVTVNLGVVCVFRMANRIYGTATGVALGVLALIPLFGFVIRLLLNGKATTILRQHGLRAGLFGVDPKAVDRI